MPRDYQGNLLLMHTFVLVQLVSHIYKSGKFDAIPCHPIQTISSLLFYNLFFKMHATILCIKEIIRDTETADVQQGQEL